MFFRVLGPVVAEVDGQPISLPGARERCLLGVLLLALPNPVSIDRLIHLLWADSAPDDARSAVYTYVSRLRRVLREVRADGEREWVTRGAAGYRINVGPESVDLHRFTHLTDRARIAADLAQRSALLREALQLWRGPALADVGQPEVRQRIATGIDELRQAAHRLRVDTDLALGRHAEVSAELATLLAESPSDEHLAEQLMRALHGSGRRTEALDVYRRTREHLAEQFGLDPGARLEALHTAVLRAEQITDAPSRSDRVAALPAHTRGAWHTLPRDVADFTGRRDELASAGQALTEPGRPAPPLVVISGPGGVGKTALAVRLARNISSCFPDGQIFIQLTDPDTVRWPAAQALHQVLTALGAAPTALPITVNERSDLLRHLTTGRRILFVFDDAHTEQQIRPLLPADPGCGVVVTSRNRLLGLDGTHRLHLGLLSDDQATALLYRIAGDRVAAAPDVLGRVLRACGGLPLALRIAANRLSGRLDADMAQLAARLEGDRRRLDTLRVGDLDVRACLTVSNHTLSPALRQLMCGLAQLDTRTLPAWTAMAIRDTRAPAAAMLDRLVETSLLQPASSLPGITSYQMHDLVRLFYREVADRRTKRTVGHFALRRVIGGWLTLARAATDAVPSRHILDREPASPWSPPQTDAAATATDPQGWLATHLPDLAAAASQAAREHWPDLAWSLVHRMSGHLFSTGQVDLLTELLAVALRAAATVGDIAGRACLLRLDAHLSELVDRTDRAVESATEAASLYRLLDDERCRADCHTTLAFIAFDRGDLEQAQHLFTQVRQIASTLDDPEPHLLARAYQGLGHCARELGDLHTAQQLMQRGVDAARDGDPFVHAGLLRSLGTTQRAAGDLAAAHTSLLTALDLFHAMGDSCRIAYVQTMLADVLCDSGEITTAQQLAETALPNLIAVGDRGGVARVHGTLASVAIVREDHATARHHLHTALAVWEELGIPRLVRQTRARLARLDQPPGLAPTAPRQSEGQPPTGTHSRACGIAVRLQ